MTVFDHNVSFPIPFLWFLLHEMLIVEAEEEAGGKEGEQATVEHLSDLDHLKRD